MARPVYPENRSLDRNFWGGLIAIPGFEIEPFYQENVGRAHTGRGQELGGQLGFFVLTLSGGSILTLRGGSIANARSCRAMIWNIGLATALRRPPLDREAALVPILLDDTSLLPTSRHQAGGSSSSDISLDRSQAMDRATADRCAQGSATARSRNRDPRRRA
jgi:hypothetical protein